MIEPEEDSVLNVYEAKNTSVLRRRLEVQSFLNLSCDTLQELRHWWRFTPTLNWFITLVGTLMASPDILFIQAMIMFIAIFTPAHPFDWIYNYAIRHMTGTSELPKSGHRRKQVFALATVLLILLGSWFYMEYNLIGYIQGGIMTLLGALLVLFNLCVASEILAKLLGMPKK